MMAILVILGTFMEWIAIIFITVPVFAPVVRDLAPELGMTPEWAAVWFGILFVMNIQIYFLSPPFGPACFWLKSVAPKDVTLQEIFISVIPFICPADHRDAAGHVHSANRTVAAADTELGTAVLRSKSFVQRVTRRP